MQMRIAGVFIPVTDLQRSMVWYEKLFGLEPISTGGGMAGYKFPQGEALLALVQVEQRQEVQFEIRKGINNCYFNFETVDIESVHRSYVKQGVQVTDIFGGESIRIFHLFDPDGNRFDVVEETPNSPFYQHALGQGSW
jgi:glyoxylase I family protein